MSASNLPEKAASTATVPFVSASKILAEKLDIDPTTMISVIKAQCFKGVDPGKISNEMLAAYINVAKSLQAQAPKFNPLAPGMLYAYPSKNGGIEPMIGPVGIYCLLNSRPDIEGYEVNPEFSDKGQLLSMEAIIWVKGKRPYKKRVYLHEWKIATNPNWIHRTAHMLEIRAIKQCASQVIYGMPMIEDDLEVIEAQSKPTREPASRREGFARLLPAAPPAEPQEAPEEAPAQEPASAAPRRGRGRKETPAEPYGAAPEEEQTPADELPMDFAGDTDQ